MYRSNALLFALYFAVLPGRVFHWEECNQFIVEYRRPDLNTRSACTGLDEHPTFDILVDVVSDNMAPIYSYCISCAKLLGVKTIR